MFLHHLLLIYRNFKRHKVSFFINLAGLATGLCCTLLIYLWVMDELKMDQFHQHEGQLYQVMQNESTETGIKTSETTSAILPEALLAEMPEISLAVGASPTFWMEDSRVTTDRDIATKAIGKFVGKDFFKVFSYPLIAGSNQELLNSSNKIVISESLAKKLFPGSEALGKTLKWGNAEWNGNESRAIITGVFKDTPANSSDHFDFVVPMDVLFNNAPNFKKWESNGPGTFIVLKQGTNVADFNSRLKNFLQSKGQDHRYLFIRPYSEGYLYGQYENGKMTGGRIENVKLFSLIAGFILVIAAINFMNLSTAKASRRMKEVGVKKVMGAHRGSLILQYLGESLLLTLLAMFIALLATELLLPKFNLITNKNLFLHFDGQLISWLLGTTLITGLVSGSYPALYLSGFSPSAALKGKLSTSLSALWTRRGLVTFQFTLSIVLIAAVLVIYQQVKFVQMKNPGYQKDNVLYFDAAGKLAGHVDPFIEEIKHIPGVLNASSINRNFLGDLSSTTGDFSWEGRNKKEVIKFQRAKVNNGLIETMGMKMVAGRSFSPKYGVDSLKIIINEAGIKAMRLKNPVGKSFNFGGKDLEIIGIVKDFNFESLHQEVTPMFLRFEVKQTNKIMIRIASGKERETIAAIQQFYEHYNPGYTFEYRFLDQDFQAQYTTENRMSVLSGYFASMAIFISCLGLFGLATFTAERRLKEIGVRKVLGASKSSIIMILSKDFITPVLVAIVIALPLSYIITRYWLDGFAYRIVLQPWYFLMAGALALLIAWATVVVQAVKAAAVNPIQCLKAE